MLWWILIKMREKRSLKWWDKAPGRTVLTGGDRQIPRAQVRVLCLMRPPASSAWAGDGLEMAWPPMDTATGVAPQPLSLGGHPQGEAADIAWGRREVTGYLFSVSICILFGSLTQVCQIPSFLDMSMVLATTVAIWSPPLPPYSIYLCVALLKVWKHWKSLLINVNLMGKVPTVPGFEALLCRAFPFTSRGV